MEKLFFSLVVPAHNEAGYIEKTIQKLRQVDYPENLFEVIIVENGSTDNTNELINKSAPPSFKIVSIDRNGVSAARNAGIANLNESSDWVIFLDADTYPERTFLNELNTYLQLRESQNLGCGMVSLLPDPDSLVARGWYHFYNFANHATKTTRSIQIIRRDLLRDIKYDENLSFGEDTKLIKECQKKTRFFYLGTKSVYSSTRRFQKKGWIKQLFLWVYLHFLPEEKKKKVSYEVLR